MLFITVVLSLLLQNGEPIKIENAWIRTSAKGANSAMFFDVVNNSDKPDTLYKAESNLSEIVEVHETFSHGDMMGMRKIDFVVIPPKSIFNFKPRAHHVMLIKLKEELIEDTKGEVTLYFKSGTKITVNADIKDMIKMRHGMKKK